MADLSSQNLLEENRENVYIVTMRKPPENRLNAAFCQDLIRTFHSIQRELGPDSEGAVILKGNDAKFFCTGIDLDERSQNAFASSDGFYPLLATILDFPYPTIALITGHVFGGAGLLTMAHDYRVMNSKRGYWQMPPANLGLHHDGMGSLLRLKLQPKVARKILLEAHKYKAAEALEDGFVDAIADPEEMLDVALKICREVERQSQDGCLQSLEK